MSYSFTHNLTIKVFSVILAIALWYIVDFNQSKISSFPGEIPIEYKGLKDNLTAISDEDSVSIKIFTEKTIWKKLSQSTFTAKIDLAGLNEGVYELPILVVSSISEVQIVEKNPSKAMVRIEPSSSKMVPVTVKPEGELAKGKTISSTEISPERITIKGAKSIINNISEVVTQVNVKNQSESISVASDIVAYDNKGNAIKSIMFDPPKVNVKVIIEDESTVKNVGVLLKTSGNIKDGFQIEKVSLSPSIVSINGNAQKLRDIANIETQIVNLSDIEQSKSIDVGLDIPEGLKLKDNIKKVKVTIEIKEINISKEFLIPINISKLSNNNKVSKITPSMITIVLNGPKSTISNIGNIDLSIKIDGSSLVKGENEINLNNNHVQGVPEGVNVVSLSVSTTKVEISD